MKLFERMDKKQRIRSALLKKRGMMSEEDVESKSLLIQKQLEIDSLFRSAETILFYVSYGKEVSTHQLIKQALMEKKQVLVPCSDQQTCTIDPRMITSWDELSVGAYGILEPLDQPSAKKSRIDLIILPGVGFDMKGNRIGHGKGYYDRLIHDHPTTPCIGLAYESQILLEIPVLSHDKKVDRIFTEKRVINCKIRQ